jgi:hypothetical protein
VKKPWRNDWKKPRMEELNYSCPTFSNFKLTVVFAEDLVLASHYIADRDYLQDPNSGDGCEAFTVSNLSYAIIYLKPDAPAGTIAHESYHAVCALLKSIGATEEHEIVAYLLGDFVNIAMAFQKKVSGRFKCPKKSSKSKRKN